MLPHRAILQLLWKSEDLRFAAAAYQHVYFNYESLRWHLLLQQQHSLYQSEDGATLPVRSDRSLLHRYQLTRFEKGSRALINCESS